jgi:hypothetical protein
LGAYDDNADAGDPMGHPAVPSSGRGGGVHEDPGPASEAFQHGAHVAGGTMPSPMWNTWKRWSGGKDASAMATVLCDQGMMNGVQIPSAVHCSALHVYSPAGESVTKCADADCVVHASRLLCLQRKEMYAWYC